MGLFKKKPNEKESNIILQLQEDPASESGLSKQGEQVVRLLAMTRNFEGLERSLRHPSPKVRAHVVMLIKIAGCLEPSSDGGVTFVLDVNGFPTGTLHPRALELLKKAAIDSDAAVSLRAQAIIDKQK